MFVVTCLNYQFDSGRGEGGDFNMEVLVVDDDAIALDIYAAWLRAEGHEVTCVDGRGALVELTRRSWDVLLVDILMPNVDGLEVIMAAKAVARPPRIVAMSDNGIRSGWVYLRLAEVLGAELCLSKPLERQVVTWAVEPRAEAAA
jgi:CheY-like chemotaxis protein